MATGRILTSSFEFETRQHELMGLDLGEGLPRQMLVVGGAILTAWFSILTLIFGLPSAGTFIFYFTAPLALVYVGFQKDKHHPRRKRITTWCLWVRYALLGHRPFVAGRRTCVSFEFLPASQRWNITKAWGIARASEESVWDTSKQEAPMTYGATPPIDFSPRCRLVPTVNPARGKDERA